MKKCLTCKNYHKYYQCEDWGLCRNQNSDKYLDDVKDDDNCRHHCQKDRNNEN